jgi:hypothetical protein
VLSEFWTGYLPGQTDFAKYPSLSDYGQIIESGMTFATLLSPTAPTPTFVKAEIFGLSVPGQCFTHR